MAIEKTVKINVDTGEAVKGIDSLSNSVKDLDKATEGVGDGGLSNLSKSAKGSTKSVGGLSVGFKGLGTAIKATGIGLLVSLLAGLADALSENQRVAKFFKVGVEAVSIVMQDFINFVLDNTSGMVSTFKAIFNDPVQSIKDLGDTIKTYMLNSFKELIEVLGLVGKAFGELASGEFKKAFETVKQAGKELVDVATGVDGTFDKVVDGVGNTIDALGEYGSKVLDTAQKNIQLAQSAEIAAAKQGLLVEQYDRQAEKLRQIRDNDLKSIDSRIEANDELLQVLNKQEKAMLQQADAILASAAAQARKNNSTENQVALLEAQANKAGVLAQIEGLRSEQEANRVALIKEAQELEQSGAEATEQRALREKEFRAEQESDELKQLELKRQILAEERVIEEERLQLKIDSFEKGTQARLDAENELRDRLQEIKQEDEELAQEERDLAYEKSLEDAENEALAFEERRALLDERAKEIANDASLTDAQSTKLAKENSDARKKLGEEELNAKLKQGAALSSALNTASELLGKSTTAGKVAAVASTTIDTISSGVSAFKGMVSSIPGPVGIAAGAVAAAGALASGFASVKKILAVKTPGGGGGGAPSAPSAPSAPAFNLVGSTGVNQVQESLQEESNPIQAVVVGSEVTNQQEVDRAQADSASIG